jgi:hypothetical protein
MRIKFIIKLLLFSFSIAAFGQKKKPDSFRYLRVIISNNLKFTDTSLSSKPYETFIITVTLDAGKVKEVHFWSREDSKMRVEVEKILPLIKAQWYCNNHSLKYVYVPLMTIFSTEDESKINEKGAELANILMLLSEKTRKDAYFDKLLVLDDIVGRKMH